MGRKKRGAKRTGSATKTSGADTANNDEAFAEVDDLIAAQLATVTEDDQTRAMFSEAVDLLEEKAKATRLASLQTVISVLGGRYSADLLESYRETVLHGLAFCMRKGTLIEKRLSALGMAMVSLTVGVHDATFADIAASLSKLIGECKSDAVVAQAVASLALSCLVSADDPESTVQCVEMFQTVIKGKRKGMAGKYGPLARAAACNAYALLLSYHPDGTAHMETHFHDDIAYFHEVLESESVSLDERLAAGLVVALLMDVASSMSTVNFVEEMGDTHDALIDTLHELATSSARHLGRETRKTQKARFRLILDSVTDGTVPEDTRKVGNQQFTLDSWPLIIAFDAVRDVLRGGLFEHLGNNELLSQIFPSIYQNTVFSSAAHKRRVMSPNSAAVRNRKVQRGSDRDNKRAQQTAILFDD